MIGDPYYHFIFSVYHIHHWCNQAYHFALLYGASFHTEHLNNFDSCVYNFDMKLKTFLIALVAPLNTMLVSAHATYG